MLKGSLYASISQGLAGGSITTSRATHGHASAEESDELCPTMAHYSLNYSPNLLPSSEDNGMLHCYAAVARSSMDKEYNLIAQLSEIQSTNRNMKYQKSFFHQHLVVETGKMNVDLIVSELRRGRSSLLPPTFLVKIKVLFHFSCLKLGIIKEQFLQTLLPYHLIIFLLISLIIKSLQ